ncbi:MAG: hypothetical protein ACJ8FC_12065, partial [Sphingomicrobium sp.]
MASWPLAFPPIRHPSESWDLPFLVLDRFRYALPLRDLMNAGEDRKGDPSFRWDGDYFDSSPSVNGRNGWKAD